MEEGEARATFAAAVELFNRGRYLAAHELWEELWEATSGPDSGFYKGLIQAAVALHHLESGNAEGAAKLFAGHRSALGPYLPAHLGLDLAAFLDDMRRVLAPAVEVGRAGALDDGARPRLRPPGAG